MWVGCADLFSAMVYDWFEEAVVGAVIAFSSVEPEACFDMLLLDEDEECKEVNEVFGRRLRLARAVFVLSRARAAIDSLLVFD